MWKMWCGLLLAVLLWGTAETGQMIPQAQAEARKAAMLADYAMEIREKTPRSDGIYHVDTPAMIQRLKELNINTYYYLVWHERTDWDDFVHEFMPAAQKAGIRVIVYLVPPTESTGTRKSYPYVTDYLAWARAIAEMSKQYPNLIGWAIDDFSHNLDFYTPAYMEQMKETAKSINPDLQFYPVMYSVALNEDFLKTHGAYIDGVILAYRDDPYRNTQIWATEPAQIEQASALTQKYGLDLIWMVYASKLSRTPANPSPVYVREVLQTALDAVRDGKMDGVVTYSLAKENLAEPEDQKAADGNGYLSFFVPAAVATQPGDHVDATQTIRSVPGQTDSYKLTFRTMDEGPNAPGYHVKQLLIDGQVVWEEDVATELTDLKWREISLDLTPYLKGKSKATLTFRLIEKNSVNNYWTNVGFDSIRTEGFKLDNPEFETDAGWTIERDMPRLIGEILHYDPERQAHTFHHVNTTYLTYGLFDDIRLAHIDEEVKSNLVTTAENAMDYYFSEEIGNALNQLEALENKISAQAGKEIPQETADAWLKKIDAIRGLYQTQ
ncbi:hypothetical protein [Polycladomyces subterraneus]|uniref:Uncharacterized protein n=1 Tax=Polycladomyces subterraneus TaxID=1016997 RepID=A0ABT8IMA7_9BACL|nr:hypothetical protein [Polycladomyces subterraneus]MDN4593671.1 hypothetical protein [Polycladomyces subterraneus]